MKTIKEWFNDLTEEERKLALENTDDEMLTREAYSLRGALIFGFIWKNTPQKQAYWRSIHDKYERQNRND